MTHRLLSALDSLPHYPTIRRDIGRSGKGEIGGTMEGREVVIEERVEQDEAESGKALEERRFKVGELVEYWGGAMVRGYRTDSGEPAWVKVDYGGGVYGIKMVANTRGKLRKVQWQRWHHSLPKGPSRRGWPPFPAKRQRWQHQPRTGSPAAPTVPGPTPRPAPHHLRKQPPVRPRRPIG